MISALCCALNGVEVLAGVRGLCNAFIFGFLFM